MPRLPISSLRSFASPKATAIRTYDGRIGWLILHGNALAWKGSVYDLAGGNPEGRTRRETASKRLLALVMARPADLLTTR